MLEEACRACRAWSDSVRVAVNLSPAQFAHGKVGDAVASALAASGLEPDRLCRACLTGQYPTETGGQLYQLALRNNHNGCGNNGRTYERTPVAVVPGQ